MGKWCLQASSFIFYWIFVKLADKQDRHKISDEFEFRLDRISHFGVTCPCGWIKFSVEIWNLLVQLTFQTLEVFITFFLGAVRPRRLKLGTHVGSGQMYHVYWNQAAAAAYSSLYFQHWNFLSHFSQELWGLEDWNLVHTWTVGRCIMYFQTFFSSHSSHNLWGLEDWK